MRYTAEFPHIPSGNFQQDHFNGNNTEVVYTIVESSKGILSTVELDMVTVCYNNIVQIFV